MTPTGAFRPAGRGLARRVAGLCLALVLVTLAPLRPASAETYLDDQTVFAGAWTELMSRIGPGTDLIEIRVTPNRIEVQARARKGGARIDAWRVQRRKGLVRERDWFSGPNPVRPTGPVGDIASGFFAPADLPLDRWRPILDAALATVPLIDPGRVTQVRIARRVSLIPQPAYADLRWEIEVANDREEASVTALADGTILGADISQTTRGRSRDFLAQDDWPFAMAQQGFRNIVGDAPAVYEVTVRGASITVTAAAPDRPDLTRDFGWDGGMFTQGLLESTNTDLIRFDGNLPFALDELDLARLPQVLAAARARAGPLPIRGVRAEKARVAAGRPEVLWVVTLSADTRLIGHDYDEDMVIRLRPDATVVSVLLPQSQRPAASYIEPSALTAAIADYLAAFGPETPVYELMARPERTNLMRPDPAAPGMVADVRLDPKGLANGVPRPLMLETEADLFPLGILAGLDPATLAAMAAQAVETVAIPGAEVYRLRIWSGSPFWQSTDRTPFVDIRVGLPPRYDVSGYAVFRLDGRFVEMVK